LYDEIYTKESPEMTATTTTPVLIVGAGPAGLVTAIGLAHQGVRSLVIERHPSTSIFPRATGVSLRSMEIFRGWGIDEPIRHGGWRVIPRQATVRTLRDRDVVESPLGFPDEAASLAVSPTTAAVSPQDHLEPVLVEHLRSLGLGEVRFGTELVSFEQDADGVDVVLRDRASDRLEVVRTSFLVGADGHRSSVRAGLGIAMEGPDDLGRFVSILFRADLDAVLGQPIYGLYLLEGEAGGPPRVFVPSGADDRFVLAIPTPPGMDEAATAAAFGVERCIALVREAAGVPDLDVEVIATSAFAFSAQVAERARDGRVFLVGDANHRMTPRGGRGMNTAIADAHDLSWKLAWVVRGLAAPALLDTHAAERGPIGRRNVAMSMVPGGGGSDDGLAEDLGPLAAVPGARAPHVWLGAGETRRSTLDLAAGGLALLSAGAGATWAAAARAALPEDLPMTVHAIEEASFATAYGLEPGGAVLVRPDGIIAWRWDAVPARPAEALAAAVGAALAWPAPVTAGRGSGPDDGPGSTTTRVGPWSRPVRAAAAALGASFGMLTVAFLPGWVARSRQPAGRATTNREPAYPFGSRNTRPPIADIRRRAANRPIPDPRLRPAPPTRTKGSKTLSHSSTGTPGPSSVT
jgi:2-polyprenyl-6-methoxyphenol hydroxylase-like FAD-dependent oxidoreductase